MKKRKSPEKTPRELAFQLLSRIEKGGAYVDRILATSEVNNRSSRDRAFIRELLFGVLRWKLRLDRIIDMYYTKNSSELDMDVRNIVRLGLFQTIFMDSVPDWAAVNESVDLAVKKNGKGAGGLVNALLRRFIREGEPKKWPDDIAEKRSFELSHPLWLVRRWIENYAEETATSIIKAGIGKHPVFIRPGRVGTEIEALAEALAHEGYTTSEVTKIPGYLTVAKGQGVFDTEAFRNGLFYVQDPSAGMASMLISPSEGDRVLDLCSAPGGKATHLAAMMHDKGKIVAVDKNPSRLGLVKESALRLGLTSIECETADAVNYGLEPVTRYDSVLLDAPCSGTGVLSKRPDMKWRIVEADILRLACLQGEMLNNASSLVKPGGVLVYSTCTLEPEENEATVTAFLDRHSEFSVDRDVRFKDYEHGPGYLILPHQMEGTGAFAAKLRRE